MLLNNQILLIGYGGHGFVAADILLLQQYHLFGYCDKEQKEKNPFNLKYCGVEDEFISSKIFKEINLQIFISIGNNSIREKIFNSIASPQIINAIHPKSVISKTVEIGNGVLIAANVSINPLAIIGNGVICNTASVIDHECVVEDFAHIAPGAVLCGNVSIEKNCFIGANTVVKEGVSICSNTVVGAGSVVVKNITEPGLYFGSPAKKHLPNF